MRAGQLFGTLFAALHLVSLAGAQAIGSLPACGQTCITQVKGGAGALGCTDINDLHCLCSKENYLFGIRDCASASCGGDVAKTVTDAAKAECATATVAPSSSSSSKDTPTTPTPPSTSAAGTSSTSSTSTSSTATKQDKTTVPSSSSSSSTHASPGHAQPTSAGTSTAGSSTASASSTTAAHGSTGSAATPAASAPSSALAKQQDSLDGGAGLTTAAKAGIGIGAATGVALLIALAVCVLLRRRHKGGDGSGGGYLDTKPLQISEPLPGSSGRAFDYDAGQKQYITGVSELEMKSRRYEDMIPRQVPRHLV